MRSVGPTPVTGSSQNFPQGALLLWCQKRQRHNPAGTFSGFYDPRKTLTALLREEFAVLNYQQTGSNAAIRGKRASLQLAGNKKEPRKRSVLVPGSPHSELLLSVIVAGKSCRTNCERLLVL
jgi:hypothetical protein